MLFYENSSPIFIRGIYLYHHLDRALWERECRKLFHFIRHCFVPFGGIFLQSLLQQMNVIGLSFVEWPDIIQSSQKSLQLNLFQDLIREVSKNLQDMFLKNHLSFTYFVSQKFNICFTNFHFGF